MCLGLAACGGSAAPVAPAAPSNQVAAPAAAEAPAVGVAGSIRFDPALQPVIAPGSTIFVVVRAADADGNAVGMPLAVDKVASTATPVAFHLTEAHALVTGLPVTGDVVILARYDQDGDAVTKQPGDIIGLVRVTAPAAGLEVVLDDVLR